MCKVMIKLGAVFVKHDIQNILNSMNSFFHKRIES